MRYRFRGDAWLMMILLMKKDAKNIQDRYKKEYRYLYSKMHVETGPKSVNKTQASKPPLSRMARVEKQTTNAK